MKIAIAFSTKDRTELTKQSWPRLQHGAMKGLYDLLWVDGSTTAEGEQLAHELGYPAAFVEHNVRGGADAAIVYALTKLLAHPAAYDAVGLVENDVLLHDDWFGPTIHLFERGADEGLLVGAVSARSFEDRVLIQRDGYALMHNTGAGCVIFSRQAAQIILDNYRNPWTTENRRTFMQLSGLDIGKWWCFRGGTHFLTVDWGFDALLARHGLASLALTPSPVEMIGQTPTLAEQGLKLTTDPVELLRNDKAFDLFKHRTACIRDGYCAPRIADTRYQSTDGSWLIFPHQIEGMGGKFEGDWRLKWAQGYGPFAYRVGESPGFSPTLTIPISGPCAFVVSGGKEGAQFEVEDLASGYKCSPELPPEGEHTTCLQLSVPAGVSYRDVRLTALKPGGIFYGLTTQEPQPWLPNVSFDYSKLPPV